MKIINLKRKKDKAWTDFVTTKGQNLTLSGHFWQRWAERLPLETYQLLYANEIIELILAGKPIFLYSRKKDNGKKSMMVKSGRVFFAICLESATVKTVYLGRKNRIKQLQSKMHKVQSQKQRRESFRQRKQQLIINELAET